MHCSFEMSAALLHWIEDLLGFIVGRFAQSYNAEEMKP